MAISKKVPTRRRKGATPRGDTRVVGPFSGVMLRKPHAVTLDMLEEWDVCYDAYTWLKLHGGTLELNEKDVHDAIRRTHLSDFKLSWLLTLNDHIFTGLLKQTNLKSAQTAIMRMRADFNAQVSSAAMRADQPAEIELDQKLLLVSKFLENLRKI